MTGRDEMQAEPASQVDGIGVSKIH